jgi:hypothetical protein
MAKSSRPFQDDYRKYANSDNVFKKPKDMVRHEVLDQKRRENIKHWIGFFRQNPHIFCEMYFGIKLYPYQILMLWILQRSNLAYIVASRATAKSFIIAVWALCLAVLYPGIQVIVASKTLKQASIIISEKIGWLQKTYPNVAREIKSLTANSNVALVEFHCGSTIKAVPANDNSRGSRCSFLILEESRMVPKDTLEQVLKPFLFSRTPPYRLLPEYAGDDRWKEEGIIAYITSAWYRSEYWMETVKTCIKRMVSGDETANFLALDYLLSIYHNIKTELMIKNEMEDSDPISIQMEYLNIPSGTSGKAYFKPSLFDRKLKNAFYPQREETYNPKKNPHEIKKIDGEIRIISVDVATRANKMNDNSIISCVRLIPLIGKGYERHLVYMESHKGQHVGVQAKRIKEIFYDFESDYVCLDLQNAGIKFCPPIK